MEEGQGEGGARRPVRDLGRGSRRVVILFDRFYFEDVMPRTLTSGCLGIALQPALGWLEFRQEEPHFAGFMGDIKGVGFLLKI